MATVLELAMRKSAIALRAQAVRKKLVRAHLKRQETRRANARAGMEHSGDSRAPVVTAWFEGTRATALCVSSAGPYVREVEVGISFPLAWEDMSGDELYQVMERAVEGAMTVAGVADQERVKAAVVAALEARGL